VVPDGGALVAAAAPVEVQDWTKQAKSFKPSMTADVLAPPEVALDSVAAGLSSQGFRIKDRTPSGFRASHRQVVSGILGLVTGNDADILDRTLLSVESSPAAQGTRLTITVAGGGEHRAGRKRGRDGLTAGLQDLQRRDIAVTTTEWQRP
jgi:hypothetical protein